MHQYTNWGSSMARGFSKEALRGHACAVMRELGKGHRERVYHRAMITSLNQAGVHHRSEVPSPLYCRGDVVGVGRCDLVIGDLIIEIKANTLHPCKVISQLQKYTLNLGRAEHKRYRGMILNFNQETGAVQTLILKKKKG